MNRISLFSMLPGALLAATLLAGCSRQDDGVGPAQRAGKAIDDAGARVTGKMQEQVDKADEAARQARERAKDATEEASRNLDKATAAVGKKVEQAGEKIQQAAE